MRTLWRILLPALLTFVLLLGLSPVALSQSSGSGTASGDETTEIQVDSLPVTLDGETLFTLEESFGASTLEDRVESVTEQVAAIASDESIALDMLEIRDRQGVSSIVAGEQVILSITNADAEAVNTSRQALADDYLTELRNAIRQYRYQRSSAYLIRSGVSTLIATVILIIVLIVVFISIPLINRKIQQAQVPNFRIRNLQLLSSEQVIEILVGLFKMLRSALTLVAVVVYFAIVLGLFPWTRGISNAIFNYFSTAFNTALDAFIAYLPNLFSIILICLVTSYVLQIIRPIFLEIARGHLTIPGFYPDWAEPTFRIIEIAILALAAVIIFPYLPGFGSPAFQGISIFAGVLLSLGSTAALSNAVAGIILIYTRAFQLNDVVSVENALGTVEEKLLLVTRIRTFRNLIVTIPNSAMLSGNIINYSATMRDSDDPVSLATTVTLGYDVPWADIYPTLTSAALETVYVIPDPAPYVLQTGLGDFSVSYELRAFTRHPEHMEIIYSGLHQHIQDKCNEAGIEILSPTYSAIRDGNQSTTPESYLPSDYVAPGFQLHPLGNLFQIDLNLAEKRTNGSKSGAKPPTNPSSPPVPPPPPRRSP